MKVIVISLGGSVLVPDKINFSFLEKFKKLLEKNYSKMRFVIVTGGGSVARKYIKALKEEGKDEKAISLAGIRVTRLNALFLMQFFGKKANDSLPLDMEHVKNNIHKNKVVICGALRYDDKETSDGTAAKLANYLKCDFVNITNVSGLYTSDPRKNKNAKLIEEISWKDFEKIANKMKFKAGQHFVLDQNASRIIRKHRIRTIIVGPEIDNLNNLFNGRSFKGTRIER
jgi:uridylate kinase